MWWELTLTGVLIWTLVGMTGMGGGSLMTPILVILFGFKPALAIGTDIAHGAVFKTLGALQHRRMGNVRAQLAGWMLLGSAPMSLLGVWLAVGMAAILVYIGRRSWVRIQRDRNSQPVAEQGVAQG